VSSLLESGVSLLGLFAHYGEIRGHLLAAAREVLLALRATTKPVLAALEGRDDPAAKRALELFSGLNVLLDIALRRTPDGGGSREAARREALDTILEVMEAEIELARQEKPSQKQKVRLEVLESIRDVLKAEREKAGAGAARVERVHIE